MQIYLMNKVETMIGYRRPIIFFYLITIVFLSFQRGDAWPQQNKTLWVNFLFAFGSEGNEAGEFLNPQAISVDPKGNIYIADTENNRIQKFDAQGNFVREIGGFGWEKEQFHQPTDVCAKSALDVFVADYNNQRIERYDKDLNYISSLYSNSAWPDNFQFGFPISVTFSIHGDLFLVDSENNRILKINSFGEPEINFGDYGEGRGKLTQPIQVEINSEDQVLVSDKADNRIVVFDYFGNYLTEIGKGVLQNPHGIFIDRRDRVFVADTGHQRVVIFNKNGEVLFYWGNEGKLAGTFQAPSDVAVYENRVFVLDSEKAQVQVFELMEKSVK